jgi:hypothetical protein
MTADKHKHQHKHKHKHGEDHASGETFGGYELDESRTKVLTACFGSNFRAAESEIGHCFLPHDTHNTCCMMDDQTRIENDKAGNPIGQASVHAWEKINGRTMTDEEKATTLTGWCTCFGSTVCGYYAKNSNTRIKFVNDCGCSGEDRYGGGFCFAGIDGSANDYQDCECYAREVFQVPAHETAGVNTECTATCPGLDGADETTDVSTCPDP